jgi:hypothetical protein
VTAEVALVVLAAGRGERFGGLKQLAPAGPNGEAVMDYSIHNALAVGFGRVVVVIRSEIEEAVKAHVRGQWGEGLPVAYAKQSSAPGTAHAVVAAAATIGHQPFVVINADDLYGKMALGALHEWLSRSGSLHALVAFPLIRTLLPGSTTVTRALCERRPDGTLAGLVETAVERRDGKLLARPLDGTEPTEVGANQLVSMNAFAFRPTLWPLLAEAVAAAPVRAGECLLPTVVAGLLDRIGVVVLPVADRCVGLTWSEDLDGLRREVRRSIVAGELPARVRSRR